MIPISRRTCIKRLSFALAGGATAGLIRPMSALGAEATAPAPLLKKEQQTLEGIAQQFMNTFRAPGLSVAISKGDKIVYREAFGVADKRGEKMTTSHLFRVASVSKSITSTAIFSLVEEGKLKLNDKVFGAGAIFSTEFGANTPKPISDITIHHLLTHTSGGWTNVENDPMFSNPELSAKELIRKTLKETHLHDAPGTKYAYSNFGYCILGRVVEKISGKSYDKFVQERILTKCGIKSMRIGGNTLAERDKNEVLYYGQEGEDPYCMNIRRMDSHGGWLATPNDLVKFAMQTTGCASPRIIKQSSLMKMMEPSSANPGYACGWAVNNAPNFWHAGSLPGTNTVMVKTSSGLCWAAFINTRTKDSGDALDVMMWKMAKAVPAWHA